MAKYKDIAEDIRTKIRNGEYTFGQKLPYEYVLCMSYHCNKETMKKALDILVKEGLIIRRRGAGTFVKDYSPDDNENFQNVFSRTLLEKNDGKNKVENQVIEFEVLPADEFLAHKLQITVGDFIYHIIVLRILNGLPYLLDISYLPLSVIPNLKLDNIKDSIYSYIENTLKLKIQSTHLNISSTLSTPLEQEYLGLTDKEPYIQEEQISYLTNGQIFEYTLSRYHYNNFDFHTILVSQ